MAGERNWIQLAKYGIIILVVLVIAMIFLGWENEKKADAVRMEQAAATTAMDPTATTTLYYQSIPVEEFRVGQLAPSVNTDMDYVHWWYSEREDCRYIFLPATADRSALYLSYVASGGRVYLNDVEVPNNQTSNLLATADTFTIRVGNTEYGELRILQSDISAIYIETKTGDLSYIDQSKLRVDSGEILMLDENGIVQYNGLLKKIDGHGNSSWDYSEKKPYNISLDKKSSVYGMGAAKKWILLSNYLDRPMLRNSVAFEMSRNAGMYTVSYEYVELYAGGSYRGTYQLVERVQLHENRIDLRNLEEDTEDFNSAELEEYTQISSDGNLKSNAPGSYKYWDIPNDPSDITGGYLLQFQLSNRYPLKAESGFVTSRGQCVQINSPKYASKAQVEYIRAFVQDLEDAIYSADDYNAKGKHYSDYLDVDSMIMSYIIQELTSNPDGNYTSFFLYKDSDLRGDGKLHVGPVWDFDLGFYNFNRVVFGHGTGNYKTLFSAYLPIHGYELHGIEEAKVGWLGKLYEKDEYRQRVAEVFFESFDEQVLSLADPDQEASWITQFGVKLEKTAAMNNAVWNMLGTNRPLGPVNGYTYEETVEYVRDFLYKRYDWLRSEWLGVYKAATTERLQAVYDAMPMERYDEIGQIELSDLLASATAALEDAQTAEVLEAAPAALQQKMDAVARAEVSGDFDDDLAVTLDDANTLLQYYADALVGNSVATPHATQMRNGDVNKDGKLDAVDAMHILRHLVAEMIGTDYPLPVAE